MKLTLTLTCNGQYVADKLRKDLSGRGFHARLVSPMNHVWTVEVSASPDTANMRTMWQEIKAAADRYMDFMAEWSRASLEAYNNQR